MTLPNFKKCLDFVLLDEPVEITERPHLSRSFRRPVWKFNIVALATSGPKDEQPFLFALAVYREVDRNRLTILSRWMGSVSATDNLEDEWVEARQLFFSTWVRQWLANHPEQLIQAGIGLGRMTKQ